MGTVETMQDDQQKIDEAAALLKEKATAAERRCSTAIQQVLKEHQCSLDLAMIVGPKGNEPIMRIVFAGNK